MTLHLGTLLALLCALATNFAFLLKHRGANAAAEVRWRHPLRSAIALLGSKWFALGMLVALGAWLLHVAALALAPLSVVQATLSGGSSSSRSSRSGSSASASGAAKGSAWGSPPSARAARRHRARRRWRPLDLLARRHDRLRVRTARGRHAARAIAPARSAGAPSRDTARGGRGHPHRNVRRSRQGPGPRGGGRRPAALASPWLAAAAIGSVLAFYASAHGLQRGEAVPVITLTSAAASITAIGGGIIVFGDPLAGDPIGIVVQFLAFALVIAAAVLTPAPVRVVEARS